MPVVNKKKRRGYLYAVGRRKTSVARARYIKREDGRGDVMINNKTLEEYFSKELAEVVVQPIKVVAQKLDGNFSIKVQGGGKNSQAEAARHGIARILMKINEDWKTVLKSKGYLTRDSRMKERKKPGLKRARRAPQWSKR